MKPTLHLSLILFLLATGGAHCLSGREGTPGAGPFPSIQGWTLKADQTSYTRSNLYELIDGAADLFLLYGFEHLDVGEYWQGESLDVRVEIYDHQTSLNAFGMYSQERKPDYRFNTVGTQGYAEEGILNFLKGKYYVKCSSHASGRESQKGVEAVARAVESSLPGETMWPRELRLLPATDRRPNSEIYVIQDYLGYSFFRAAFTARYGADQSVELFVMECENPAEAVRVLEKYTALLKENAPPGYDGAIRVADPNNGSITLFTQGNVLAGVVGCSNAEAERRYVTLLRESVGSSN